MPIYEYVCTTCNEDFEIIQKVDDPPPKRHDCSPKSKVKRKLSLSAFQLKGGGWYAQGYSGEGGKQSTISPKAEGSNGSNGSNGADKNGDSKKSESSAEKTVKADSSKAATPAAASS